MSGKKKHITEKELEDFCFEIWQDGYCSICIYEKECDKYIYKNGITPLYGACIREE